MGAHTCAEEGKEIKPLWKRTCRTCLIQEENMQYGLLRQKRVGEVTYFVWRIKVLLLTWRTCDFVTILAMHTWSRFIPACVPALCVELSTPSLMALSLIICRPLVWTQSFNICLVRSLFSTIIEIINHNHTITSSLSLLGHQNPMRS